MLSCCLNFNLNKHSCWSPDNVLFDFNSCIHTYIYSAFPNSKFSSEIWKSSIGSGFSPHIVMCFMKHVWMKIYSLYIHIYVCWLARLTGISRCSWLMYKKMRRETEPRLRDSILSNMKNGDRLSYTYVGPTPVYAEVY